MLDDNKLSDAQLICPLCSKEITEISSLDHYSFQALFYGWRMFPLLHDLKNSFHAVWNQIELQIMYIQKGDTDKIKHNLEVISERIKAAEKLINQSYFRFNSRPGFVPCNEINKIHLELNEYFRFNFIINFEKLKNVSLYINLQAYRQILYTILQGILMTIGRTRISKVTIDYDIEDTNLIGKVEFKIDSEVEMDMYCWNIVHIVSALHNGGFKITSKDDNLLIYWAFPVNNGEEVKSEISK